MNLTYNKIGGLSNSQDVAEEIERELRDDLINDTTFFEVEKVWYEQFAKRNPQFMEYCERGVELCEQIIKKSKLLLIKRMIQG